MLLPAYIICANRQSNDQCGRIYNFTCVVYKIHVTQNDRNGTVSLNCARFVLELRNMGTQKEKFRQKQKRYMRI